MEEEGDVDVSWGGAVDSESLEANMLCETNDWLRKNENSSLDRRLVNSAACLYLSSGFD
jgi:hypothetical protein